MARYYAIVLQPTLFGEVSIHRTWGESGTRGQSLLMTFATQSEAQGHADRIERQKRRRGYL